MLKYLQVSNLSVIDKVSLEFENGLNIITGETGAGKSLVIQSIKLLVGERFSREMARDPDNKVSVEGIFYADNKFLDNSLAEEFEIDGEMVVKRTIGSAGKNRVLINGHFASLKQLRELFYPVIDFHGQHEHQSLLNPNNHIYYVDLLVNPDLLNDYKSAYSEYKSIESKVKKLKDKYSETLKNKDILEFQMNEIKSMDITPETDNDIENRISYLSNVENIRNAISSSIDYLSDGEYNASGLINAAMKEMAGVSDHYSQIRDVYHRLQDLYYELDDCIKNLTLMSYEQNDDPSQLDSLISRKMKLDNLMTKYGGTLEDVLAYYDSLEEKLDNLDFDRESISKLEKDCEAALNMLKDKASNLNSERKKIAKELSGKIEKILRDLELQDSVFQTNVNVTNKIDASAGAEVEFFISTNKGFTPAPLKKIASGGELSRIMLALKEVFSEADDTPILVFDEIDTGISGVTALKVAEKLHNLGKYKQLFVITHLPVVASKGENHIHISKKIENEKTFTEIKPLDGEDKKNILAVMIAGEVTPYSLKQAEELLDPSK